MDNIWQNHQLMDLIEKRKSVRTFEAKPLTEEDLEDIRRFLDTLQNPFSVKVHFRMLESMDNRTSLGTYGVIKGAQTFIGAMVKDEPMALEALGYEMEKLMLYLVSKNIGTCWLGGTFKREDFRAAMEVPEGYLFPAITPVGYPKEEKSLTDHLVRFIAKGNQRKPFEDLFFHNTFQNPLAKLEAGKEGDMLEMVRLGPSASNKQPWRILMRNGDAHFYEAQTPKYSDAFGYDIQRLDMGIAACHFHLGVLEKGESGSFVVLEEAPVKPPQNILYRFTYTRSV